MFSIPDAGCAPRAAQSPVYSEAFLFIKNTVGSYVTIFYIYGSCYIKKDFTIESAVRHVIDDMTEGWNVQRLAAVEFYRNQMIFSRKNAAGQIHRKCRVTAEVFTNFFTVKIHFGRVCGTLKGKTNRLARIHIIQDYVPAVCHHHLIHGFVETIEGSLHRGVGQTNPLKTGIVKRRTHLFVGKGRRKRPPVIQGNLHTLPQDSRRFASSPVISVSWSSPSL